MSSAAEAANPSIEFALPSQTREALGIPRSGERARFDIEFVVERGVFHLRKFKGVIDAFFKRVPKIKFVF